MSTPAAGYVEIDGALYACHTHEEREQLVRLKARHDAGEAVDLPAAADSDADDAHDAHDTTSTKRSSKKK